MTDPKTPQQPAADADGDEFDAIAAAEELSATLDAPDPPPATSQEVSGDSFETILESEVVELSSLVEKHVARITELESEIDASRARVEKQAKIESEQRVHKVLKEFLEVLDDLDRALHAAREGKHAEAVIDGVVLVKKSFLSALRKFGVEHQPSMGDAFDPGRHDAVSMVSVSDPAQNNVVVGVVQEGYSIGGQTLRPARVAVGKSS